MWSFDIPPGISMISPFLSSTFVTMAKLFGGYMPWSREVCRWGKGFFQEKWMSFFPTIWLRIGHTQQCQRIGQPTVGCPRDSHGHGSQIGAWHFTFRDWLNTNGFVWCKFSFTIQNLMGVFYSSNVKCWPSQFPAMSSVWGGPVMFFFGEFSTTGCLIFCEIQNEGIDRDYVWPSGKAT